MSSRKITVEEKIDLILRELSILRKDVDNLKGTCSRMDDHIGFVEKVYTHISKIVIRTVTI